jgi:nucleotide-binding universal stress UspA family protein
MEKILLPFDGSAAAMRAVEFVMKQAAAGRPLQVQLINVQAPVRLNAAPAESPESVRRAQAGDGERVLQAAQTALQAGAITCTQYVAIGDPAQSIVRYAQEQGSNEIVMGTRGMSSIANLVLGSVATKVIHLVDIPVTLVK